ncbi:hypothetical protein [Brucella sp. BZ]|uniref:hypothetical protein n=1 Tax=Brucella sp. BZ TaxID=3381346 RepID=UPI0039EBC0AF
MASTNNLIYALNGGEVGSDTISRIDLAKMRLASETCINFFPKTVGPIFLRPGTEYRSTTRSNKRARLVPFVFSATDTAQLEFTGFEFRPLLDGRPIIRPAVTTVVSDGGFATGTGWTLVATDGASSQIVADGLALNALAKGSTAYASQQVTVPAGSIGVQHALRINVTRGPVRIRIGSTGGGDQYVAETSLDEGYHSIAFTPTGNFWVQFQNSGRAFRVVRSCQIEAAGELVLLTPWAESILREIRFEQSADVVFCTHQSTRVARIERRGTRSWSVVTYPINDGPFLAVRTADLRMKVSATEGLATLTASAPFFKAGHVGAVFRLFHTGQYQTVTLAGPDQWSEPVRLRGVAASKQFFVNISGTWAGTLQLQLSMDGDGYGNQDDWNGQSGTFTTNQSGTIRRMGDEYDNVTHWARIGFRDDTYSSGAATVALNAGAGGGAGMCRVLAVLSDTTATVEVTKPFFRAETWSDDWKEGIWSGVRGWPSAVALHEGRLWLGNKDSIAGSVSDAFDSFDPDTEGDAGPIIRSIATGPINYAQWILSLGRMVIGTSGAESVPRSSSFDEPMTPTNFTIKDASTQGSANVQPAKIDRNGIYVQRSGKRLYELSYDSQALDYASSNLTRFNPEIAETGVVELAVQRQPDSRVWCVLGNGQCGILLYEKAEDVTGWHRFETDGQVVSVCVTPGTEQDFVWLTVLRNGNYYNELLRFDTEAIGGMANRMADAHVYVADNSNSATVTGLSHLNGRTLVVWADGKRVPGTFTVSAGSITLPYGVTTVCVGLPYKAQFKSTKLSYSSDAPMNQSKRLVQVGVVLKNTALSSQALRFGDSFDKMDPLPRTLYGVPVDEDAVLTGHESRTFPVPGSWQEDARLCIEAYAPYPVQINSVTAQVGLHDKR